MSEKPDDPAFHFLLFAPGLQSDWLFTAARRYWQRFRPTVINDLSLAGHVSQEMSTAITSIARKDTAGFLRDQITQNLAHAYHDELVYDTLDEVQSVLDARVDSGLRFG